MGGKHTMEPAQPRRAWQLPIGVRGWLEENDLRRLLIAFAIAIAIHEIFAGLFPRHNATMITEQPEIITIAKVVRITHRPKPTPPPPTPTPPPPKTHVIAPTQPHPQVVKPAPMSQPEHIRRVASARPIIHTKYHSKPIAHLAVGGHGIGSSKTAKAVTGGVGSGGTGSGQGGQGSGVGGALGQTPCGYVEFIPTSMPSTNSSGGVNQDISITVHYPDNTTQTIDLDYPFTYPALSQDPFMPANKNLPALFQFPPVGQRASEPPLVQYVMSHTTAAGYTTLQDCPGSAGGQ